MCETGLTRLDFGVEEVELQGKQHEQYPRVDSESRRVFLGAFRKPGSGSLMDVTGLGGVVQVTTPMVVARDDSGDQGVRLWRSWGAQHRARSGLRR